ncbi:dipeptide/oligopeptide/nickel ABC transporter ATP-binding protein [Streptomyces badius]
MACHYTAEIEAGTVKQTLAAGIEAVIGTEAVATEAVEVSEGEAEAPAPETPGKEAGAEAPEKEPATVPAQADADATRKAAGATEKAEDGPQA